MNDNPNAYYRLYRQDGTHVATFTEKDDAIKQAETELNITVVEVQMRVVYSSSSGPMSFEWLFDSGDFTPEYRHTTDEGEYVIEVMKVGGGEVGRVYGMSEAWLYKAYQSGTWIVVDRGEVTTGLNPQTHEDVAREVEDYLTEE